MVTVYGDVPAVAVAQAVVGLVDVPQATPSAVTVVQLPVQT